MSGQTIGFVGMTHLGINSAAATAAHGFSTLWFDANPGLVDELRTGALPVVEPGLAETIAVSRERIDYSSNPADLQRCELVYIASDVPTDDFGVSDLSGIRTLIATVCANLASDATLVVLCQVPPGFTREISWPATQLFYQVETLIFGRAMERAMHPERFIVGSSAPASQLPRVYSDLLGAFKCPILHMRYESAELAKIAINCCLVSSVTVANTLAELSEHIKADWNEIVPALKLDRRIGQYSYLGPGLGLAGGNLERDLATVLRLAGETGSEAGLIRSFIANSRHRRDWVLRVLHSEVFSRKHDATVAILGLAYKENTHSTKNSPSLALIRNLTPWCLRVHDPVVPAHVVDHPRAVACATPLEAVTDTDVAIIMTPWQAYRELNAGELARAMKGRTIIDPYRALDGGTLAGAGLDYLTLGAPRLRVDDGNSHA